MKKVAGWLDQLAGQLNPILLIVMIVLACLDAVAFIAIRAPSIPTSIGQAQSQQGRDHGIRAATHPLVF